MSGMSLLKALDNQDRQETSRILQTMPSEVSMKDSDERVALHYAVETMDMEVIEQIYEQDNTLVDCQDRTGMTPLLLASQSGRTDVVEYLLQKGANLNHVDKDGHSAVFWAVVCGQLDTLSYLIKIDADVKVSDHLKSTPLHYSTASDDMPHELALSILHVLLRAGAEVNALDIDERTPIHWCASNGNLEAMQALKQAGGDVQALDRDRLGVLHCAASHGFHEVIDYFFECSPRSLIDQADRSGHTPLFYAVTFGHYDAARKLLAYDANPNYQDNRLRTPAHCAAAKGQLRMLKLLRQYAGSFQVQNYRGDLPVHEAVQTGGKDLVEWFLALDPSSMDSCNHEGRTCLHLAAANGNLEMVIFLCSKNAFLNPLLLFKDQLYTPLDLAYRKDHPLVIDYLEKTKRALRAAQMDEKMVLESKNAFEQRMLEGKALAGRHMERSESVTEMASNKRKGKHIRRRRSSDYVDQERIEMVNAAVNTSARQIFSADGTTRSHRHPHRIASPIDATQAASHLKKQLRATMNKSTPTEASHQNQNEELSDVDIPKDHQSQQVHRKTRVITQQTTEDFSESELPGISDTSEMEELDEQSEEEEAANVKENRFPVRSRSEPRKRVNGEAKPSTSKQRPLKNVSMSKDAKKTDKDGDKLNKSYPGKAKSKHPLFVVRRAVSHDKEDEKDVDIYEDDWEGLQVAERSVGKDATRKYIHEKSIFQELTHLKRMQIQYGKVQEKILVHSLVANFCKMHGLDPANFKFSTFYAWEKFLYEQLKGIYLDERQRLTNASLNKSYTSTSSKRPHFETRLRQARAIPLNDKIERMNKVYGNSTMTSHAKRHPTASTYVHGQGDRRCDCLDKHLLIQNNNNKNRK